MTSQVSCLQQRRSFESALGNLARSEQHLRAHECMDARLLGRHMRLLGCTRQAVCNQLLRLRRRELVLLFDAPCNRLRKPDCELQHTGIIALLEQRLRVLKSRFHRW